MVELVVLFWNSGCVRSYPFKPLGISDADYAAFLRSPTIHITQNYKAKQNISKDDASQYVHNKWSVFDDIGRLEDATNGKPYEDITKAIDRQRRYFCYT